MIEELYNKFESRTPPLTEDEWWDYSKSDLFEFAKLYAEHYAKLAIRNTRYKAIEVVQANIYHPRINSSGKTVDVDRVIRDIQNIDNKEILPEHD